MANTDKQNFRYPDAQWEVAKKKTEEMRAAGYPVDLTKWLGSAMNRLLTLSYEEIAEEMKIEKQDGPARILRRPYDRTGA